MALIEFTYSSRGVPMMFHRDKIQLFRPDEQSAGTRIYFASDDTVHVDESYDSVCRGIAGIELTTMKGNFSVTVIPENIQCFISGMGEDGEEHGTVLYFGTEDMLVVQETYETVQEKIERDGFIPMDYR